MLARRRTLLISAGLVLSACGGGSRVANTATTTTLRASSAVSTTVTNVGRPFHNDVGQQFTVRRLGVYLDARAPNGDVAIPGHAFLRAEIEIRNTTPGASARVTVPFDFVIP